MKKRTRIIIFLSVISMYSLQIFADELREIKTLDEINKGTTSRTNVSKPAFLFVFGDFLRLVG